MPLLLPRVAQGDRDAIQTCLRTYSGLVWALARRHLGPDDAEDVVQEVFVSLWQSASRYDPAKSEEATFVAMIARRRIADRLRRAHGSVQASRKAELSEVDLVALPSLDESGDARRAAAALEALPEDRRRVLVLSIVHDLSHGEIAERTGIPLGTVKSHVRRGLETVRQSLAERSARPEGGSK